MLAAVVAAAGLGVTAWGTLVGAEVANDQLEQSQQQAEADARQLASRVSAWEGRTDLFIANRSPDPTRIFARVYMEKHDGLDPREERIVLLGTAPPCTRLQMPYKLLGDALKQSVDDLYALRTESIIVREASGDQWERNLTEGNLTASDEDLFGAELIGHHMGSNGTVLLLESSVTTIDLEGCGS